MFSHVALWPTIIHETHATVFRTVAEGYICVPVNDRMFDTLIIASVALCCSAWNGLQTHFSILVVTLISLSSPFPGLRK